MTDFETKRLPLTPDVVAPDGSDVRVLARTERGSMAHFELAPGRASAAIRHRTVDEIWFVLSGRGEIMVFERERAFPPPTGEFFEVVIKPDHPPVLSPPEIIAPEKNAMLYEGENFFVFAEQLAPGDTRARHSHSQRVVIQFNRTRLQQWPDGGPEKFVEIPIEQPGFSPPVIHVVKNVGDAPLFGIVIEFKPQKK